MIGLIALAILSFWGFVSYKLSDFLVKKIKSNAVKYGVQTTLCVLLFLVPVADDIAGGFQFRALCNTEAVLMVDEEKARGKNLTSIGAKDSELIGYILPITKFYFSYKDLATGETVVSWNYFIARGGWLSRTLNILGSDAPYTFNGNCAPENGGSKIFKKLNIKVIYN